MGEKIERTGGREKLWPKKCHQNSHFNDAIKVLSKNHKHQSFLLLQSFARKMTQNTIEGIPTLHAPDVSFSTPTTHMQNLQLNPRQRYGTYRLPNKPTSKTKQTPNRPQQMHPFPLNREFLLNCVNHAC